jgi:hypothetical protein
MPRGSTLAAAFRDDCYTRFSLSEASFVHTLAQIVSPTGVLFAKFNPSFGTKYVTPGRQSMCNERDTYLNQD